MILLRSKGDRGHTHKFLPSWMIRAATMVEQRRSHIHLRLWHQLREREGRSWNVLTRTASITPKTCAITAITGKEKRKKPMHVSTKIKVITPAECAKTATWPNTTSRGKRKEMPKMKSADNQYYQRNQFKIITIKGKRQNEKNKILNISKKIKSLYLNQQVVFISNFNTFFNNFFYSLNSGIIFKYSIYTEK